MVELRPGGQPLFFPAGQQLLRRATPHRPRRHQRDAGPARQPKAARGYFPAPIMLALGGFVALMVDGIRCCSTCACRTVSATQLVAAGHRPGDGVAWRRSSSWSPTIAWQESEQSSFGRWPARGDGAGVAAGVSGGRLARTSASPSPFSARRAGAGAVVDQPGGHAGDYEPDRRFGDVAAVLPLFTLALALAVIELWRSSRSRPGRWLKSPRCRRERTELLFAARRPQRGPISF